MEVVTRSPALKSGTAPRSGVEDGDGLAVDVGFDVADGDGEGVTEGVGVGGAGGGRTQPASTRATRIGAARLGFPTGQG